MTPRPFRAAGSRTVSAPARNTADGLCRGFLAKRRRSRVPPKRQRLGVATQSRWALPPITSPPLSPTLVPPDRGVNGNASARRGQGPSRRWSARAPPKTPPRADDRILHVRRVTRAGDRCVDRGTALWPRSAAISEFRVRRIPTHGGRVERVPAKASGVPAPGSVLRIRRQPLPQSGSLRLLRNPPGAPQWAQ